MFLGRAALYILIYSYQISLGTPPIVLAIQLACLAIAITALFFKAIQTKNPIFSITVWLLLFLFASYLLVAVITGLEIGNTPTSVMGRFMATFLTTISLPLFAYAYNKLNIISLQKIMKHIIVATGIYCAMKVAIIAAFMIFDISPVLLTLFFQKTFNTTPTLDQTIGLGLLRFMSPADYTTPLLLFYCVTYLKGWSRILLSLFFALSLFISYSRFLWAEGLFALTVPLFRLSRGQILAVLVAALVAIPTIASIAPSIPLIENRFMSSNASWSDSIRTRQYDALTQGLDEHLLFGHGLASFSFSVIRDTNTPYSYELQWMELIYQIGLVGLLLVIGMAFLNCAPLLASPSIEGIPILLLYSFFLLSGLANPSLIGRSAGVNFAFVLCLSLVVSSNYRDIRWGPTGTTLRSPII